MALPEGLLSITLTDGRTLAYREYGDPNGLPCIYTTGSPASGLAGKMLSEHAREMGVRWISPNKPGLGYSTFQPGRTLLDWPKDVTELAGHLGLERFAVAGESGGGPHALALAYAFGDRITTAIVISGGGPADDPAFKAGMSRVNRMIFALADHAPWALSLPMSYIGKQLTNPAKAEKIMQRLLSQAPETDREFLFDPVLIAALAEAYHDGARGATQEMQLFAKPWGFRLEDITTHVDLFHGEQDVNMPVAVARAIAAKLPDCNARFCPEYGHAVAHHIPKEVMQCVPDAA